MMIALLLQGVPFVASDTYGPNPQQTLRLFETPLTADTAPACLVFLNSGYDQNQQIAEISVGSEPLQTFLRAGLRVVTATVTYPGQDVPGKGRFLPPSHPSYALGDRVERDAVLAWNRMLELAQAWGIDPKRSGLYGRSGGTHPVAWLAYHAWPEVAQRPAWCVLQGPHTWWPSWGQTLGYVPAKHFYHASDTTKIGSPVPAFLAQVALTDQQESSFLSYAEPTGVPCLWYASDMTTEGSAVSPPPVGITAGHSPWFSVAGYDHLRTIDPNPLHFLALSPPVASQVLGWGVYALPTPDAMWPAVAREWVRQAIMAVP